MRCVLVKGLQCLNAVGGLGANLQLRPQFGQDLADLGSQQRFILGDQGGGVVDGAIDPKGALLKRGLRSR